MKQQWLDEYYMREALSLAHRGMGRTSPNPMVGCVIVRDGKVIGKGFHAACGQPHAEPAALANTGGDAGGATAYVTLEPCSHYGRTPPCAPRLVAAGIKRCVAAMVDPNPRVSGKGFQILKDAGIEVSVGTLEKEARWLNRGFLSLQRRARPWVTVKAGISFDADLALTDGQSQWITGRISRQKAHLLRAENDAVLVGTRTLLHDDPSLTVRLSEGISPRPVLIDADFSRVQENAAALNERTLVYGCAGASVPPFLGDRARLVPADEIGHPDLAAVLGDLAQLGVARLLVEGGAAIISSFLRCGYADEFSLFVAPSFLGRGKSLTEDLQLRNMDQKVSVKILSVRRICDELWIGGVFPCSQDWLNV